MNHFKYKVGDIVLIPSGRYWIKAIIVEVDKKLYNDYLSGYYQSLPRIYKVEVNNKMVDNDVVYAWYHAKEMKCHKAIMRDKKLNEILN